jgi:hypothetical protein
VLAAAGVSAWQLADSTQAHVDHARNHLLNDLCISDVDAAFATFIRPCRPT